MKSLFTTALLCASVLLTHLSQAAESGVSGNWIFNIAGPNGEAVELPMELNVKEKKLEGRIDRGGERWMKLKDGKIDGQKFSFTVERDRSDGSSMVYAITGKLEDGKLTGEAKTDFQGRSVTSDWSADRKKDEKSAIAGNWILHLQDPNGGEIELPMELKIDKQALTGRVGRGGDRWMELKEGKIDGDAFTFNITRDRPGGGEMSYTMKGKLEDKQLKGTATTTLDGAGEVTGDWHATRAEK